MSIVICKLPRAGLGNQLFPLAKAAVFAHLNDLPMIVVGYNQLKIGPWLRREKTKRNYRGYFTFEKGWVGERIEAWRLERYKSYEQINEPEVKKLDTTGRKAFVYSAIPHWKDYFAGLKEHRELAIRLLQDMIREPIKRAVAAQTVPCIGVHIRMGDFRKLQAGEDFSSAGAVRTPEEYFIEIIEAIRKVNGRELPVSVFTDGYRHEFERLFSLGGIHLIEGNKDIVDLLLLSGSKIIVASAGSTFSYWSGFLSESPLIVHPAHLHEPNRPESMNSRWYEGPFDLQAHGGLLEKNIKAIYYE